MGPEQLECSYPLVAAGVHYSRADMTCSRVGSLLIPMGRRVDPKRTSAGAHSPNSFHGGKLGSSDKETRDLGSSPSFCDCRNVEGGIELCGTTRKKTSRKPRARGICMSQARDGTHGRKKNRVLEPSCSPHNNLSALCVLVMDGGHPSPKRCDPSSAVIPG